MKIGANEPSSDHRPSSKLERVERTNTYRLTPPDFGSGPSSPNSARVVIPTLTDLAAPPRPQPPAPRRLTTAWRAYERELDAALHTAGIAA